MFQSMLSKVSHMTCYLAPNNCEKNQLLQITPGSNGYDILVKDGTSSRDEYIFSVGQSARLVVQYLESQSLPNRRANGQLLFHYNNTTVWRCQFLLDIKWIGIAVFIIIINIHLRKSRTNTDPSDADAPTLSPREFQQTSKIPAVPR